MANRFYVLIIGLLGLLASGVPTLAIAQVAPIPCFTFNSDSVGCVPLQVRITSCASGVATIADVVYQQINTVPKTFTPANPTLSGSRTTFDYTVPGVYYLTQFITYDSAIVGGTSVRRQVSFSRRVVVLSAQTPLPNFAACRNYQLKLSVPKRPGERFNVNWGNGTNTISASNDSASYDTVYQYDGSNISPTITVTEIFCNRTASLTPTLKRDLDQVDTIILRRVGVNRFRFTIGSTDFYNYVIEQQTGNTLYTPIEVTRIANNIVECSLVQPYSDTCFRILIADACGNQEFFNPQVVCYQSITATAFNSNNRIEWREAIIPEPSVFTYSTFYRLFKNGLDISGATSATSPTVDNDIICGQQYCYELETFATQIRALITPVILSYSNVSCTQAINSSIPPAVTGMQVSVVEPDIWVRFTTIMPDTVSLYRTSADPFLVGNPHLRQPTNAPVFDRAVSPDNFSYCYTADYKDLCGNQSPRSVSICSIRLQGALDGAGNRTLNWNLYNGYDVLGLQTIQTLQILDNSNRIIDSVRFTNGEVTYSENQKRNQSRVIKYRIKASTILGAPSIPYGEVYSNAISLEQPAQVAIPDAFTPNGDGLNDVFRPLAPYTNELLLEVYNRWGEIVFRTTTLNDGWDGNYAGRPAQGGPYIYYIRLVDDAGTITEKKGTVTLLR